MQRFADREIRFAGTRTLQGWTLKIYGVHLPDAPIDWPGFDRALELAVATVPEPEPAAGRPGLGVFIAHQGRTGDYGVLGWWNHENELPFRIMVRRNATDPWRTAVDGESICVWDLEIVWEERQAWVDTMLTGTDSDPAAYLRRVPERFERARG